MALAAAVLPADRKTAWERLEKTVLLGELAPDGRVRPVKGVLPAVLAAKREGWPAVVVPIDNLAEASLVDGVDVWGARTLGQSQTWLAGKAQLDDPIDAPSSTPEPAVDLADVVGQQHARYAVEVAAAGAHHLMLTGPPGVGKTTLAQRLPGLLPPLSDNDGDSLGGRAVGRQHTADHPAAVHGTAPDIGRGGAGRRRVRVGAAGCGQPCPPGCAVSRRACQDRCERTGGTANPVGKERGSACATG